MAYESDKWAQKENVLAVLNFAIMDQVFWSII